MRPVRDPQVERRSELLLDLIETAERMLRENLRREFPEASPEEIEHRVMDWYLAPNDAPSHVHHLREIHLRPR